MTPEERQESLELVKELQRERSGGRLGEAAAADIPHILMPSQARFHADMSPVRFAVKGRRVGFTFGGFSAEAALEAARANGGMDQFYMGYNQGMAAEFIGDCASFARWYGVICSDVDVGLQQVVINDEKQDIVTYKIKFASGHKIEALSAVPHNWRGRQGHARIDEAGHVRDLMKVIEGALAYLMWGGRVSICGTQNGEDNPLNELLKRIKAGSLGWSLHEIYFQQAVREGLYRRICLMTKKVWTPEGEAEFIRATRAMYPDAQIADQELEGIPLRGSGVYFSRLLLEKCADKTCDVLRFAKPADFVLDAQRLEITQQWFEDVVAPRIALLPPDQRTVFGQDFGRNGDLSVIVVGQKSTGLGWRTPLRIELRTIPFDCQWLIVKLLGRTLPLFAHAKFDARGNGQSHAEAAVQEFGPSRVERVMFTPKWYDEHWPKYHHAYEDGEIETFGDEDWIQDHRSVILVNGQARVSEARIKGSDGHDRHGDAAIAGLLMWAASHSDAVPSAGEYAKPSTGASPYGAQRPGRRLPGSLFGGREAFQNRANAAQEDGGSHKHTSEGAGPFRRTS